MISIDYMISKKIEHYRNIDDFLSKMKHVKQMLEKNSKISKDINGRDIITYSIGVLYETKDEFQTLVDMGILDHENENGMY